MTQNGGDRDPDMDEHRGLEAVRAIIERAARGRYQPDEENAPDAIVEAREWPEPQPLAAKVEPEPYPLDALPDTIRAAVEEVVGFVKAPVPMVASSALAALSLACQAHIDVRRLHDLSGPVSLFLLTIADSGERRSTCEAFFTSAIRQYQEEQAEAMKPAIKRYREAIDAWKAKHRSIKGKIRRLSKDLKSTADLESALSDLEQDKPEPPRVPRLLYAYATPEALAHGLSKWPSAGVLSSDAGVVLCVAMRNLALLNRLWDGDSLYVGRRTSKFLTVDGARVTMGLMVHEAALREYLGKLGGLERGMSFLARFLLAWPESTIGTRMFTEGPEAWPHLDEYHRRIAAILNHPAPINESGALTPTMLSLAPDAKAAWVDFHNAIESELGVGGEFYGVSSVANRSADNAARLAALFHVFEHGIGGAIGAESFEGAARIAAWHLSEARRFFVELALPPDLVDAARLDGWLIEHCRRERTHMVPVSAIQKSGPIGLRSKSRMEMAVRELEELNRVRMVGGIGKARIIKVNPALLGFAAA